MGTKKSTKQISKKASGSKLAHRQKQIRKLEAEHTVLNAKLNSLRFEHETDIGDLNVARLRSVSGEITDTRLLVLFLYMLMRDTATPGRIEQIMLTLSNAHSFHKSDNPEPFTLTNGYLGEYAQDVANRLLYDPVTHVGVLSPTGTAHYNR